MGELRVENDVEVVILFHEGRDDILVFDILVRKDLEKKKPRLFRWLENALEGYITIEGCPFVRKFLVSNRNFRYLCSEDLRHIASLNVAIIKDLIAISKKFKTKIVYL